MELETLPDAGLVQDTDQFLVSRAGAARRASGAKLVRVDAQGNAQLAGNPRLSLGALLMAGTRPLLGGDATVTTLFTGTGGLVLQNSLGNAALLSISDAGGIQAAGTLNVAGSIRQNGQQVWHTGNFNPAAYQPAGNYAPAASPVFTGAVVQQANPSDTATYFQLFAGGALRAYLAVDPAGTYLNSNRGAIYFQFNSSGPAMTFGADGTGSFGNLRIGGNQVWHAGNFNPAAYAALTGATFTGPINIVAGGTPSFALRGSQPYFQFASLDGSSRFGYLQHTGAGGSLFVVNDQGSTIVLQTGGVNVFQVGPSGASLTGALDVSGALRQAGQQVWHTGNFNPAGYASLAGASFSGSVFAQSITTLGGRIASFPTDNPTTYQAATQSIVGESSRNPSYYLATGYWLSSGVWRGVINSVAGGGAAPLDIQPGGGNTFFGGGVYAPFIAVNGQPVWHAGNFNPSSYAVRGADVSFRDLFVTRGDGSGVVYFGDGGTYLYYDGVSFVLAKGGVIIARIRESEARFRGNVIGNLGDAV